MSDYPVSPQTIEPNSYQVGEDFANQESVGGQMNDISASPDKTPKADTPNNVPTMPPHYNIVPGPGGSVLNNGRLTSANFLKNKSGWGLQADGSGYFTDIDIGNHYITVDVGENIQDAIDSLEAGGIVVLRIGTHIVDYDINIPSGVYLQGENRSTSIIDFNSNSKSIKLIGSAAYSDGTVSVSNGSTTVTGSSTAWLTNAAVGQSIRIGGAWYPIAAVTDDTHITIGLPYAGSDLSGAAYVLATIVYDVMIKDLTVKNSAQAGIQFGYASLSVLQNLVIQTCATALEFDYVSNCTLDTINLYANNYGCNFANVDFITWFSGGDADSLAGNALTLDTVNNSKFDSLFILNAAGDGLSITSCNNLVFTGVSAQECAGQGCELVSGNSNIVFLGCAFENNDSDGLKFTATSDTCFVSSSSFKSNGGYGINLAASTCDNNVIGSSVFASNSSGAVNDSGTGTQIRGNSGVEDNNLAFSLTASGSIAANDPINIPAYADAIAFERATDAYSGTGGNISFAHVCNGRRRALIVGIHNQTSSDTISNVQYGGENMTLIRKKNTAAAGWVYLYYLLNPRSGSNNVTLTNSASDPINVHAATYTGVLQSSQVDASNDASGSPITSLDVTVTTVTNNCWVVGCAGTSSGGNISAGTSTTKRTGTASSGIFDNNAPKTPAGNVTLQATAASGGMIFVAASIKPVTDSDTTALATRASAISASGANMVGFASNAANNGESVSIKTFGVMTGFSGLTPGSVYYLTNASGIGTSAGTVSKQVGIATSATTLLIQM